MGIGNRITAGQAQDPTPPYPLDPHNSKNVGRSLLGEQVVGEQLIGDKLVSPNAHLAPATSHEPPHGAYEAPRNEDKAPRDPIVRPVASPRTQSVVNLEDPDSLRGLLDAFPHLVWTTDGAGSAEYYNNGWLEFTGLSQQVLLGEGMASVLHPEDRARVISEWRGAVKNRTSLATEVRILRHDGVFRHCFVRANPVYGRTGVIERWIGTTTDVHEERELEHERRRAEEERQRVVNAVPGIVWEMSPSAHSDSLSFISEQVTAITGYTADEFRNGKAAEIVAPEELARAIAELRTLGIQREVVFDLTLQHAAGHTIVLESHVMLTGEGSEQRVNGVSFDVTHDRLLQYAAQRGEQLLNVITHNLPALICYIDKDERYRFTNRAHQQWWNKQPEDILGRTIHEVSGDEFYETIRHQYRRAMSGEELHFNLKVLRGGLVRHLETSFMPHYDGSEIIGLSVLSLDVTERVEAEQASKQSDERFRAIADNAPSLLWLSDDRGMRFFFNRQWYEFTGSTPEENFGDGWQRFIDARDRDRFLRAYGQALESQSEFQLEYRMAPRSGETDSIGDRWVLCQAAPRFSDTHKFLGLIGSVTDIRVQKLAEIAILRSHEYFRQLAESMPHIIWTARPDGTGEYWNRFWFEYTGLTEEQCQRPVLRDGVFHPADLKQAMRQWKEGLASAKAIEFEIRIRRASDGLYRWHLTRTVPVFDAAGVLISWVGSVIDIHDQKVIHDELRDARDAADAANKAKDHFLATLSHELRTPLTPVLTTIETLELDEHLPPSVEAHIATIRRNIELEARLIDDLLDLTRITRGKIHLSTRTVEVHGLLANVLEICRRDVTTKRIDIHLGLRAQDTYIIADPARLQQVLWNVLQNAVKFTPAEGRITIRTSSAAGRLKIEISDTGIGIESSRLTQIFRPFEQGAVEITKQFGGLGLGLAISKMLVDRHEGTIEAQSEGPGKGSTIVLEFAIVEAPAAHNQRLPLAKPRAQSSRAHKILLVDDHADTASSVRILLERRGYNVAVAGTMNDAIQTFKNDVFDLIISDIGLPDGSGWELITTVQSHAPVHAIALSGFCTEQDIERSHKAGFDIHLTKPFNFNDLHREIELLLDAKDQALSESKPGLESVVKDSPSAKPSAISSPESNN
jgi:PAS domain S-box-containing protein